MQTRPLRLVSQHDRHFAGFASGLERRIELVQCGRDADVESRELVDVVEPAEDIGGVGDAENRAAPKLFAVGSKAHLPLRDLREAFVPAIARDPWVECAQHACFDQWAVERPAEVADDDIRRAVRCERQLELCGVGAEVADGEVDLHAGMRGGKLLGALLHQFQAARAFRRPDLQSIATAIGRSAPVLCRAVTIVCATTGRDARDDQRCCQTAQRGATPGTRGHGHRLARLCRIARNR